MLGVSSRDGPDAMRLFVRETLTDGFVHLADVDGDVWEAFDVGSQPAFAFINDSGEWATHVGALGFEGIASRVDWLLEN